MADNRIDSRNS